MPLDPAHYRLDEAAYRNGDHPWVTELAVVVGAVGPLFHRMGTRAIGEADWLLSDAHRDCELALRRQLVADGLDEVFASTADAYDAGEEAASVVIEWLARHRPVADLPAAPDDGAGEDRADEDGAVADHPLVRAGLQVQEDLCLMQRDETGWRLTARLVCFPTYWRLGEKMGRSRGTIHGPVPHYADELSDRVGLFFDRLAPGRIVARRNRGFSPQSPAVRAPSHTEWCGAQLRTGTTVAAQRTPDVASSPAHRSGAVHDQGAAGTGHRAHRTA